MKKAFDQTVRDIKREVNKKVLKVPGIEQKVLDATSNEPWGPHGSLLADIAQASRNHHEYQMIMGVMWKRISDTGKNWRHVYKGLTVLEYLVAHGSERVIDEIRERAYQISTLSNFQYIDSSGRDQGNNVRKKSQSLVALVNDKERIIEVREKAAANRDKFRSSAAGGMYRPSSYSGTGGYGDRYDYDRYEGRYGSRDEDGYGYGRERQYGYRGDDRYSREGDHYSRYSEERYDRDEFRDDDYRGRSRNVDNYQYGSRSRSSDRDRGFDDDARSSSRGSGARAENNSQDGRPLERKFSEQNIVAPPSHEDVECELRNPVYGERNGEASAVSAPGASPPATKNANKGTDDGVGTESSPARQKVESFDEFDPRDPVSAGHPTSTSAVAASSAVSGPPTTSTTSAPATSNNVEMDLLDSLSDSFSSNPLAIVPVDSASVEPNAQANSGPAPSFSATQSSTQPFDDPFGETPFKAIPSTKSIQIPLQSATASFQPTTATQAAEDSQLASSKPNTTDDFGFGNTCHAVSFSSTSMPDVHPPSNSQVLPQKQSSASQNETDILAGILPLSGPPVSLPSQPAASIPTSQLSQDSNMYGNFHPQTAPKVAAQTSFGQATPPFNMVSQPQNLKGGMPFNGGSFIQSQVSTGAGSMQIPHQVIPSSSQHASNVPPTQPDGGYFLPQKASAVSVTSHIMPSGPALQKNNGVLGGLFSPAGPSTSVGSQPTVSSSTGALVTVTQPSKEKFEPKSAIWADTLSRGLVNFNISGRKTNPLADIGVDFDAINRKEKRFEKPASSPVTSSVMMGKAMGSGSGLGRTGASSLRPPPNHMMMGSGMPVGGGYGGMNAGRMNIGMRQRGYPMQPHQGMTPSSPMPGGYNPMMDSGGYNPQQPYRGGYQ